MLKRNVVIGKDMTSPESFPPGSLTSDAVFIFDEQLFAGEDDRAAANDSHQRCVVSAVSNHAQSLTTQATRF